MRNSLITLCVTALVAVLLVILGVPSGPLAGRPPAVPPITEALPITGEAGSGEEAGSGDGGFDDDDEEEAALNAEEAAAQAEASATNKALSSTVGTLANQLGSSLVRGEQPTTLTSKADAEGKTVDVAVADLLHTLLQRPCGHMLLGLAWPSLRPRRLSPPRTPG